MNERTNQQKPPRWKPRPDTQDAFVIDEVYTRNCYGLPADLSGVVLIDVGANVGAFAVACLERGAEHVFAYEPDRDNFALLVEHLEGQPRRGNVATMYPMAVVGDSHPEGEPAHLSEPSKIGNVNMTGGRNSLASVGEEAAAVRIGVVVNQALELAEENGWRVWLKLDCEGSEYTIVASRRVAWGKVERILGEVHQRASSADLEAAGLHTLVPDPGLPAEVLGGLEFSAEAFGARLEELGFEVELDAHGLDPRLATFRADRRDTLPSVAALVPLRNARPHLERLFKQLDGLRLELEAQGLRLRVVVAEGDSQDGTREEVGNLAGRYGLEVAIVDTTHGGMVWQSVEDPQRMQAMSRVMNAALAKVRTSDTAALWIMGDLVWDPAMVADLVRAAIDRRDDFDVLAPLAYDDGRFYDTWAYRDPDGARLEEGGEALAWLEEHPDAIGLLSSAGTCLAMRAELAREFRATDNEAVSWCAAARKAGHRIGTSWRWKLDHVSKGTRRILWVGDAVVPTGFARITHALLPELASRSWEIDVVGIGYGGTPHALPYRIWPPRVAGEYPFGELRLRELLHNAPEPFDLVVVLQDPWNVPGYLHALKFVGEDKTVPPVLGWIAVDGENQANAPQLNALAHVATWTEFGLEQLTSKGYAGPGTVVPLGVDHEAYFPRPQDQCRAAVAAALPEGSFVFGAIGRNQPRKRWDLLLEAFAHFLERTGNEDAYLFLHVLPIKDTGVNLAALAANYGLTERVLLTDPTGKGQPVSEINLGLFLSAFDVFVSASAGEGWGLPALEAMACGTPCILPEHSAYGEWAAGAAHLVAADQPYPLAPLNGLRHTIGRVPSTWDLSEALERLYVDAEYREKLSAAGLEVASRYSWKATAERFADLCDQVVATAEPFRKPGSSDQEEAATG